MAIIRKLTFLKYWTICIILWLQFSGCHALVKYGYGESRVFTIYKFCAPRLYEFVKERLYRFPTYLPTEKLSTDKSLIHGDLHIEGDTDSNAVLKLEVIDESIPLCSPNCWGVAMVDSIPVFLYGQETNLLQKTESVVRLCVRDSFLGPRDPECCRIRLKKKYSTIEK